MKKLFLLLLTVATFALCASAQTRTVRGSVVQAGDNEPIVGASVKAVGGGASATTDLDGKFAMRVPSSVKEISVSYVGCATKKVLISDEDMRITLDAENELEEVITVAYGTTKKESFTGSADVVKGEKLAARPVSNITKALDGQVAGVQMTTGSGAPGSGSSMMIRGWGSLNADTTPLYVVDGIPFEGAISAIPGSDIENIVVLKDASAGALYGARGANGVVLITTKRGNKEGKTKVELSANWGFISRSLPRYDTLDEKGYLEVLFQSFRNHNMDAGMTWSEAGQQAILDMTVGAEKIFGEDEQYNPFNYKFAELIDPETGKIRDDAKLLYHQDWLDTAMRKNPMRQEYTVQFSGANEKTNWRFALGYLDEKGLAQKSSFERYSGRMAIDTKVTEWFKAGINANYARTESNSTSTSNTDSSSGNIWNSCQMMAPIFPVYMLNPDGTYALDADGNRQFDYGANRPAGASANYNAIGTLTDNKIDTGSDWFSARANAVLGDLRTGPIQGLKFTVNYGMDLYTQRGLTYRNPFNGDAVSLGGSSTVAQNRSFSFTLNELLGYDRKFGQHHVDFLVGHEFYKYNYKYLSGYKTGFAFGGLYELDAAANVQDASSYQDNHAIESVLSRFNYDFADKYYFSASLRTDGTSRFYKDSRWGTFWSVGANWRISQEKFMEGVKEKINNLALRASYGVQGNESLGGLYAWQALYALGYTNGSDPGALVSSLAAYELRWEKNGNLNIGLEGRLFNRFNFNIEWYNRRTKDMLMDYPQALSSGFESYPKNIGNMRNIGMDITLRTDLINNSNLHWDLTLIGSFVRNKVLNLADKPEIVGVMTVREGEPINSFYVAESAGVDPTTGQPAYWAYKPMLDDNGNEMEDKFGHLIPDPSTRYMTTDVTEAWTKWRKLSGNRIPDFYGSIGTSLQYKNFDFTALCTYSIGGKIIDSNYMTLMYGNYTGQAKSSHLARAWQKPGDITDVARVDIGKTHYYTDADLIDASYFAIKNVGLGYTLPRTWLNKIKFESVRFSVTGDNLFLFNRLKGMDNQQSFSGSASTAYTPTRTVSFGIDVTF